MKRKKTGSIAIPFLITFLISLVVIGGIAMVIYDKIDGDESSLVSMANEVGTLSDDDSHTIMFALDMSDTIEAGKKNTDESSESDERSDEDDEEDDDGEWEPEEESYSYQPYTFIIMRSKPVDKKLTFLGIPCNMLIGKENRMAEDIYIDNGVSALKNSLEFTLGIDVDRYMVLNTETFAKICNILGGVTSSVPKGVEGVTASKDEQYLSASQIMSIISCGSYPGGEMQRISTAVSLVSAMVNQTSGERIAGNLDNTFTSIINMVESDISAIDYSNRKYAIKFMLRYSDPEEDDTRSTRAGFITPYGDVSGSAFVPDKYFPEDLKAIFGTPKNTEETTEKVKETAKETDKETESDDDENE